MKRNKLTLLVAILLLGTMLLASCSGGGDPTDPPMFPDVNEVENNHSEAIGAWTEYLSYIAPETVPNYKANEILSDLTLNNAPVITDDLIVITETKENYVERTPETTPADPAAPAAEGGAEGGEGGEGAAPVEPIKVHVSTTTIEKWYDVNTGNLVKTFTTTLAVKTDVEGVLKYDESINPLELVEYEITHGVNGLIKIETTTLALKEAEPAPEGTEPVPVDLKAVASYEENTVISYYFADGTLFLDKLENALAYRAVANNSADDVGRYLLDCEELNKTFLMERGELVREFGYYMEHNVPVYDETSVNLGGAGYAYFEQNGNKYLITEAAPTMIPVGDLYLFLVPGITIDVTDKDDKVLVSYESDCYAVSGYAVLSNGNIYICEFELLNRDSAEYDILSGEDKLNVHNKIINITDGSVTELDLGFKTSKLFNNTTKEIKSFLNFATLGVERDIDETLLDSAKVKDGFILAEIQKYKDGALDLATTWAVLDESLNIVKELPAIVADQFTYPAYMNADTMIVSTKTVGTKVVYYGADVKTGEVTLLPDLNALNNITVLDNGYFWGKKVYSKEWKLLRDFNPPENVDGSYTVYTNFQVINGDLYYYTHMSNDTDIDYDVWCLEITATTRTETRYEWDKEKEEEIKIEWTVTDYNYDTKEIAEEGYILKDGIIAEVESGEKKFYSLDDKFLFGEEKAYTFYVDSEKLGRTVRYKVTETLYGNLYEIEDGYLVCVKIDYVNDSTYTSEQSGLPNSFSEYELYIIK